MADTAADGNHAASAIAFLNAANEITDSFDANQSEIDANKLVRDELYRTSGYMFHSAAMQKTTTSAVIANLALECFIKAHWFDSAGQSFAKAGELDLAQIEELYAVKTALSVKAPELSELEDAGSENVLTCFRLASAAACRAIKSDYSDSKEIQRALLTLSMVLKIAVVSELIDALEAPTIEDVILENTTTPLNNLKTFATAIATFISSLVTSAAAPDPLTIASMTYLVSIFRGDLSNYSNYPVLYLISAQTSTSYASQSSIIEKLLFSTTTWSTQSPANSSVGNIISDGQVSLNLPYLVTSIQNAINKLMETAQYTTTHYLGQSNQSTNPMLTELQLSKELANRLIYLYS